MTPREGPADQGQLIATSHDQKGPSDMGRPSRFEVEKGPTPDCRLEVLGWTNQVDEYIGHTTQRAGGGAADHGRGSVCRRSVLAEPRGSAAS